MVDKFERTLGRGSRGAKRPECGLKFLNLETMTSLPFVKPAGSSGSASSKDQDSAVQSFKYLAFDTGDISRTFQT